MVLCWSGVRASMDFVVGVELACHLRNRPGRGHFSDFALAPLAAVRGRGPRVRSFRTGAQSSSGVDVTRNTKVPCPKYKRTHTFSIWGVTPIWDQRI